LPLCVDLDGTLLKIDTLHEAAFASFTADWRTLLQVPRWLACGRAHLKHELAKRWSFDPAHLPYNQALVDYLSEARASGRSITLATAADRYIAEAIARHVGLFD